jgi:hypothetical protein
VIPCYKYVEIIEDGLTKLICERTPLEIGLYVAVGVAAIVSLIYLARDWLKPKAKK